MRPPATGRCAASEALAECLDQFCPDLLSCSEGHAVLSGRIVEVASEQSCEWQGPTYVNWTEPIGYHPETYHDFGAGLLRRMRQSSIFATVICDWQYALAQAEHSGRFVDVGAPPTVIVTRDWQLAVCAWAGRALGALCGCCCLSHHNMCMAVHDSLQKMEQWVWQGQMPAFQPGHPTCPML